MYYLLKNAQIVNEGEIKTGDVYIKNGLIDRIDQGISPMEKHEIIDLRGSYLLPGCIDDQVHFREPGLEHKATIFSESRAAVAGGITSFMEMPNTLPPTLTQNLLQEKYLRASQHSIANYSFYMGTSNDNIEEVLKTDPKKVCGVKIFMGSSTGNMLVDNPDTLANFFSKIDMLIATHCEDEQTIRNNIEELNKKYSIEERSNLRADIHPKIRSADACYISSSKAVELAKKHGTRLHILHMSTAKELALLDNSVPLKDKKITAEACIHHLWFSDQDYLHKQNFIKWNPSIKTSEDRRALWQAVLDDRIDVIATDHAPHTLEEKSKPYLEAPAGGPLVQHALVAMLEKTKQGIISIEKVVEKMAHAPAILFQIKNRGFIRPGYQADLVVVEKKEQLVQNNQLLYKCSWSPFMGEKFSYSVSKTFVNGNLVWENNQIREGSVGERLVFERK